MSTNTVLVSTSSAGAHANGANFDPAVSADGRYIVFQTYASNLLPDGSALGGIVRKDLMTGEVVLVSSSSAGVQANAPCF